MKTYGELMTELSISPYSKDMFDLHKESAELEILEAYIENQNYILENFEININNEYIIEAVNRNMIGKALSKVGDLISTIGTKIWTLITKLFGMISRSLLTIKNWIQRKFNKVLIIESAKLLKKSLKSKNDPKYKKILNTFNSNYRQLSNRFNSFILPKHTSDDIKKNFNNMNILFAENLENGLESDELSLTKFFNDTFDINSEEVLNKKAEAFINMAMTGCTKIIFKFKNNNIPIMSIDNFLSSANNVRNRFTTLPKSISEFIKWGSAYAGSDYATYKILAWAFGINVSTLGNSSLSNAILSLVFLMNLYETELADNLFNGKNKYENIFKIDIEKDIDKSLKASFDVRELCKKISTDVLNQFTSYANSNRKEISQNNEHYMAKIAKLILNEDKDEYGKQFNRVNNSNLLEGSKERVKIKLWSLLNLNPETISVFKNRKIISKYNKYITIYDKIILNMLSLLDISINIGTIMLIFAADIVLAYKKK